MQLSARGCNVASPKVCNSQYVSALSKDSRGMFFLLRPTDSLILQISREPRGQYTLSTGSRKVTDLFGSRSRLLCERRLSLMKYIYVASALPVKCMFMATNPGSLRISAHNPVSSAPQVHLFLLFSSPSNPTVHSCHVMICAIIFANVKTSLALIAAPCASCATLPHRGVRLSVWAARWCHVSLSLKSVFSLRSVTNLSPRPTGWQARGKDQCRPRADGRQAPAACRHTELELQ